MSRCEVQVPRTFAKGKRRYYFVHRLTARRRLLLAFTFWQFPRTGNVPDGKKCAGGWAVLRFLQLLRHQQHHTIVTHSLTDYYLRDDKMAFWGLKVEPGKWTPFVPPPDEALRLHISQVSPG